MSRPQRDPSDGFTLIELLVVMTIIGILAAIAVPLFLNNRHKAFETRAKADVTDIAEHATAYYIDKTGVLTASGGPGGDWSLSDAGGVVETSKLSDGDKVVGSDIQSDILFCIAVQHYDGTNPDSKAWTYDQDGLHVGNTC